LTALSHYNLFDTQLPYRSGYLPTIMSSVFQKESTAPAAAAAAAATANDDNDDDAAQVNKLVVLEQLTSVYGFDTSVAEQALQQMETENSAAFHNNKNKRTKMRCVQDAVKYILDNGLAADAGGSVVPKEDCPHVVQHVKISLQDLPSRPDHAVCSYYATTKQQQREEESNSSNHNSSKGQLKRDDDYGGDAEGEEEGGKHNHTRCPLSENWLCLECGVVRCSRYVKGHSLAHWHDTQGNDNEKNDEGTEDGHCIAASLADLSVWCHQCDSYLRDPILDPILQRLEQLKFQEAGGELAKEPQRKKARPSRDNSEDESETGCRNSSTSKDDDHSNANANDDSAHEDDGDGDSDGSELSPTIIAVANAVARGIPVQLFQQSSDDEEDLEYPFDSVPTSLEDVANFIQSDKCRSVVILAGAGMSVAAGIPDFRSADGLYATMNPDLITANPVEREAIRMDPTVALEKGMFLQNPLPCLELNREFILGTHRQKWKATLAHRFVELLHAKTGKLVRLYTQNIDGLEDQCSQLPRDKVIAVHGSMDRAECAACGEKSDFENFCHQVRHQIKDLAGKDPTAPRESRPITCSTCGYNSVKPAIVLFRENLPMTFFENVPRDILDVDLLIVIGTSLRVAPANSLVWRVPKTAMRLLVNREPVGWHLGMNFGPDTKRDYHAQGNCDDVLLDLMSRLGWLSDLEPLVNNQMLPLASEAVLRQSLGRDEPESSRDVYA